VILGVAHGAYGVGGTIGPIIATSMAVGQGWVWSRYYIVTLIICLLGVASAVCFRGYEREMESVTTGNARHGKPGSFALLIKALKYRTTLLGVLFTFVYQGAEVAISGWTISFLLTERGGDPSKVGYVTAGFWVSVSLLFDSD
jgi:fucose permease